LNDKSASEHKFQTNYICKPKKKKRETERKHLRIKTTYFCAKKERKKTTISQQNAQKYPVKQEKFHRNQF
jgi:hypothetical protein